MKRKRATTPTTTRSVYRRRGPATTTARTRLSYKRQPTGIAPEKKFFDGNNAVATVSNTGAIVSSSLNLITEGTGQSQRIGRKCKVTNIHVAGLLTKVTQDAGADTNNVVRIMLYLDTQCNGATASVTDILATANLLSFRNLQNSGRFRIYYDKRHALNNMSGANNGTDAEFGNYVKAFKINIDCDHVLEFDASTGAITDLTSNNFGILMISQEGVSAQVTADYYWRVRFYG